MTTQAQSTVPDSSTILEVLEVGQEPKFRVQDVAWNRRKWGSNSNWPGDGEGWSAPWGSSEAQWFGSLYPRLHRFLPTKSVLEIAPGLGRWTKFLVASCANYLGIDMAENCVSACRQRFTDEPHVEFVLNDGRSLDAVPNASFDLVFSFDSLVHAELDVFEQYVPQVLQKLAPGGVAFIHHSNLAAMGELGGIKLHVRSHSVSGAKVEELVTRSGGMVLIQEVINWVDTALIDCLTLFARAGDFPKSETIKVINPRFMEEARIIRESHCAYSRLEATNRGHSL